MKNNRIIAIIISVVIIVGGITTTTAFCANKKQSKQEKDISAFSVSATENKEEKTAAKPQNKKAITVSGKTIAMGLTTLTDLLNQGCKTDFDPDTIGKDSLRTYKDAVVTIGGKDYGVRFLADHGQQWKDATVNELYALPKQEAEIVINGNTVILGKTTYQELLKNGWKTDVNPEIPEEGLNGMFEECNGVYAFNGHKVKLMFDASNAATLADVVVKAVSYN